MNSNGRKHRRMCAALILALLLATAVVGLGFAYQSVFQNKDNTSDAEYIEITSVGDVKFDTKYQTKTVVSSGVLSDYYKQIAVTQTNDAEFTVSAKNIKGDPTLKLIIRSDSEFIRFTDGEVALYDGVDGHPGSIIVLDDTTQPVRLAKATFTYDSSKHEYVAEIDGIKLSKIWSGETGSIVKFIRFTVGPNDDWTKIDADHPMPGNTEYVPMKYHLTDSFMVIGKNDASAEGGVTGEWDRGTTIGSIGCDRLFCVTESVVNGNNRLSLNSCQTVDGVTTGTEILSYTRAGDGDFAVCVNDVALPVGESVEDATKISVVSDLYVKVSELNSSTKVFAAGERIVAYSNDDTVLHLSGSGEMCDFSSGAPWSDMTNLTKVVIDEGSEITSIGDYAFADFLSLSSIVPASQSAQDVLCLPSTVASIGAGAFMNTAITAIDSIGGVTAIGDDAFSGCHSLSGILTIPAGVTLGASAFSDCGTASNGFHLVFEEMSAVPEESTPTE